MSRAPKVSILVPIYNVEEFLPECLESLVSQTLQDIEIICINDGSTDSSPEIIKEYADKDPRIKVITKPNSGYGDSMNKGLKKATGEYIGIVESDDWIDPEGFEDLYHLAHDNQAEVVRGNYYHYKNQEDTKFLAIDYRQAGFVLDPHDKDMHHIFFQAPAIWSAIYKRDFLKEHHINFLPTPGASYQDTGFNFKVWASAHRVIFTNSAYLHYRMDNENSSVKSLEKVYNVNKEYAEIEQFLNDNNLLDDLGGIMETAKFGAYYWNATRLPFSLSKEFLATVRQEFTEAESRGLVDKAFFGRKLGTAYKLIMDYPPSFFLTSFRIEKGLKKVASGLSHLHRALRPAYRRQRETLKTINRLTEHNEALSRQITNLEKEVTRLKSGGRNA